MKKILTIVLVVTLVLGLCACGETKQKETAAFRVGYAREDITPKTSVPLAGYGLTEQRMSEVTLDRLYATCVAITDQNDSTVLLFSLDNARARWSIIENARPLIQDATGVSPDRVLVAATHTHSAPDTLSTLPVIEEYNIQMAVALRDAAVAAMADRAPATAQIATTEIENMNFVRHYKLSDGSVAGDNHGDFNKGTIEGHVTDADNVMQLIRFVRTAEGKKDVLMMNWQGHPCATGGAAKKNISADIIGSTRSYIEQQADVNFVYFTGASGNVNIKSRIEEENPTADYTDYIGYGKMLGDHALAAMQNMTDVTTDTVKTKQVMYEAKRQHAFDHLVGEAQQIWDLWSTTGNMQACIEAGAEYGIASPYHAGSILNQSSAGETKTIETDAVSLGDLGFILAPYEMFDTNGMYIKENSPYKMTFVLCGCHEGYIPSAAAYDYGCYEADTTQVAKGTGEELAEHYLQMLQELKD